MNNSEVNRRSGSADADDRTIREYYTKAFRGVVEDSQPGAVMSSYNSVNGVPTAADPYLIDTLMRQTFGFLGYFTGDCDAVSAGINPQHHWQPAGFPHPVTVIESLAFALGAGEDAECNAGLHEREQLPRPDRAEHDRGRDDERDRDEHHDGDGPAHGQRPRRVGRPPVHEPHEARRVRPGQRPCRG